METTVQEEKQTSNSPFYINRINLDNSDWKPKTTHFSYLVLYLQMDCPFCIRVINYLEKLNKIIEIRNIKTDFEAKEELLDLGGKTQVPCLSIDGKALYESLDIIRWISENKESIPDLKE